MCATVPVHMKPGNLKKIVVSNHGDRSWHELNLTVELNGRTWKSAQRGFLGTDRWRERVREARDVPHLVDVLREQLEPFGYGNAEVRYVPPIKSGKNVPLYHLVFLAKNPLGDKIWQSVVRVEGSGQKRLFS